MKLEPVCFAFGSRTDKMRGGGRGGGGSNCFFCRVLVERPGSGGGGDLGLGWGPEVTPPGELGLVGGPRKVKRKVV